MGFRISALRRELFAPLFGRPEAELAARGVLRRVADRKPGYPCRVSLRDAEPGEVVLLLNFEHHADGGPYRSSHAIFVREHAEQAVPGVDEVPEVLRLRLLSVRAFDERGLMVDADVVHGREADATINGLLADPRVAYLHVHNAKPGCFAARVDRA